MHSKVVIASLVCMLAASFGAGNKVTSDFKKTNRDTKEMVCHAPNDDDSELVFANDITSTDDEARAIFTSNKAIAIARVIKATPGVNVRFEYSNDCVEVYITPNRTKTKQAVALGFSTTGKKINTTTITKTVYIYNDGQHCCFSALSEADVAAKYFMNYVATPEQAAALANGSPSFEGTSGGIVEPEYPGGPDIPDPHPDPWPPFPPIPNPNPPRFQRGFEPGDWTGEPSIILDPFVPTAEEAYVNYIFGDIQDMEFTVSTVLNDDLPQWGQHAGTFLKANVNWYDENNVMHPAKGVSVQFYGNGEVLTDYHHIFSHEEMSYDYRTNANGFCEVDVISDCRLNMLEARVCADSSSTRVEDNYMIDYPFFARAATGLLNSIELSEYSEVSFTINIYAKKSERGEAFAISQMQNVPYDYAAQFSDGVDAVKTVYPSQATYYDGANDTIMVQPEDKKSWDVLNHEYGHHIADELELCSISNNRVMHKVFEDLTVPYGTVEGKKLAYSEGLATYLGIASQLYFNTRFSAVGYGDEIYQDSFRNVNVDYGEYSLGPNDAEPEGVETRITGAMMKLLDNNNHELDNVSLGHQKMWNALLHSKNSFFVSEFFKKIAEENQDVIDEIVDVLDEEKFYNVLEEIAPDEWTIMIYMCGSSNLDDEACYDLNEILSVDNQPYDVNIIVETGGTSPAYGFWGQWTERPAGDVIPYGKTSRYYIKNKRLNKIEDFSEKSSMGNSTTFEEFLKWGIEEYPAKKMGVIMWNHGSALRGVCADYTFNWRFPDRLKNSEALTAFQNVFDAGLSDKFEFIGYDACLMQVQDIAEVNSHYFNYMIASEELEEGLGWRYDQWIDKVYAKEDTETILKAISDSYIEEFQSYDTSSILDLNQMDTYYNAFESLALSIKETALNDFETFADIIRSSKAFNEGSDFENTATVDGYDFLCKLQQAPTFAAFSQQIEMVKQAYNDVVLYNRVGESAGASNGLAIVVQLTVKMGYDPAETRFSNWQSIFEDNQWAGDFPMPL